MYSNNEYGTEILIDLPSGIYVFDNESATGKTRLAKELRKLQAYSENVTSYTFNDKLTERKIEDILVPNKFRVILLDRYDMYNGDGAEQILRCANNSIILIDCKGNLKIDCSPEWCEIIMDKNSIEVR